MEWKNITRHQEKLFEPFWAEGTRVYPKLIPDELIDAYLAEREEKLPPDRYLDGFVSSRPYNEFTSLLDVACYWRLADIVETFIGEPGGVMWADTAFQSRHHNWRQLAMMAPSCVKTWQLGVFVALDDISAFSGPMEFASGSNRWRVLDRDKIRRESEKLPVGEDPAAHIARCCQLEINQKKPNIFTFQARKGDVMVFHPYLIYRDRVPSNPLAERKALVFQYTGIRQRLGLPYPKLYETGKARGFYFPDRITA